MAKLGGMGMGEDTEKDAGYSKVKKDDQSQMGVKASKLDKEIKGETGKDEAQYKEVNDQKKQAGT